MKALGVFLIIFAVLFSSTRLAIRIYADYDYEYTIGNNWELADRASTLSQKSEYINKFVVALEKAELNGINCALFLKTPKEDFNENMKALKSLQLRLIEISKMDENNFAYQTAMQQITQQEQGEASELKHNLQSCWDKKNYYTIWNPVITVTFLLIQIIAISIGGFLIVENS